MNERYKGHADPNGVAPQRTTNVAAKSEPRKARADVPGDSAETEYANADVVLAQHDAALARQRLPVYISRGWVIAPEDAVRLSAVIGFSSSPPVDARGFNNLWEIGCATVGPHSYSLWKGDEVTASQIMASIKSQLMPDAGDGPYMLGGSVFYR